MILDSLQAVQRPLSIIYVDGFRENQEIFSCVLLVPIKGMSSTDFTTQLGAERVRPDILTPGTTPAERSSDGVRDSLADIVK
jgi:hypothetical protein